MKITIPNKKIFTPHKKIATTTATQSLKQRPQRNYSSATVAMLMTGMNIPHHTHSKPSEVDWSMVCDCHATSSMGWSTTTTNDILSPALRAQTNWFASSIYPVIPETNEDDDEETNEEMWSHLNNIEYIYD